MPLSLPTLSPGASASFEAIRRAAELLMNRPRLGRDVFGEGRA